MDKKSLLIGVLCLLAAFGMMMYQSVQVRQQALLHPEQGRTSVQANGGQKTTSDTPAAKTEWTSVDDIGEEVQEEQRKELPAVRLQEAARFVTLENEEFCVQLSSIGGGVQSVSMKRYPAVRGGKDPFIFNENASIPALTLSLSSDEQLLLVNFEIVQQSQSKIVFRKSLKSGIMIEREYRLPQEGAYTLQTETRFINPTQKIFDLKDIFIGLGNFPPTASDVTGDYLNFGYYDGDKAHFIKTSDFRASSGFFGMGKASAKKKITGEDRVVWGSVKNQFFTSIFTPKVPGNGFVALPVPSFDPETHRANDSIVGCLRFPMGRITPGKTVTLKGDFYVGPKDYVLLDRLGAHQDLVMQFGLFGFVSKLLLLLMKGIYSLIGNWGLTVILLTVIVKLVLWPLTTAQVRSSRKMSRLQEPLKKIKEKYRDNPQKLQAETLKLFRENRINPAAGCLPVFIQIPIFLGLYFMLRTTAEMRFVPFLWIKDLSLPDTIATIQGLPINILPLIMGVSMVWQMKMMPTPSMGGAQQWMLKVMPIIFLIFCYNFPAALVLYWTVQNLLTILQQMILNKKNDEALCIEDFSAKKKKI